MLMLALSNRSYQQFNKKKVKKSHLRTANMFEVISIKGSVVIVKIADTEFTANTNLLFQ